MKRTFFHIHRHNTPAVRLLPAPPRQKIPRRASYAPGEFTAALWSRLLLLLTGVGGMLSYVHDLDATTWSLLPVLAAFLVTGIGLWYLYYHFRRAAFLLTVAALAACGAAFYLRAGRILRQARHVVTVLQGYTVEETVGITTAMILFAVLLTIAFFYLECVLRDPGLFYLLTVVLLLAGPVLGLHAGLLTVCLLGAFQILFLLLRWFFPRRRKRTGGAAGRGASSALLKNAAFTGAVFLTAFVVLWPVASTQSSFFYGIVSKVQGNLVTSLTNSVNGGAQQIIDGSVSRGDNYPTGQKQIRIILDRKPKETVYLKGFTGGSYTGSGWKEADERKVLHQVALDMGLVSEESYLDYMMLDTYFYANLGTEHRKEPTIRKMYLYDISGSSDAESTGSSESRSGSALSGGRSSGGQESAPGLDQRRNNVQEQYRPYFATSYFYWGNGEQIQGQRPSYYYYEESQVKVNWGHYRRNFWGYLAGMRELQAVYQKDSRSMYTAVPKDILPRLTKLVRENPQKGRDNITAFIAYTLQNNTTYTRTPGLSSLNKDSVETFLFEKGQGYCVHYASAATLMYRLYGVPARYAAGYAASPSDFKKQKDGTWMAELTDADAHAWTEIFIRDYGWVPVDMTPGSDNSTVVRYPGFNNTRMQEIMNQNDWKITATGGTSAASSGSDENTFHTPKIVRQARKALTKHRWIGWTVLVLLLYTLILLPFWMDYRRMRRLERLNVRQLFALLLRMLHHYGYLIGYNGNEPDFAATLADVLGDGASGGVPFTDKGRSADCQRLVDIVRRDAFSPEPATEDDRRFVLAVYQRAAAVIAARLPRPRRFLFRYVHRFG